MTEESGYREIVVDEESELIKTLREEIKFLREMNLELIRSKAAQVVVPVNKPVLPPTELGDDVIINYEDARSILEAHYYQKAEEEAERHKKDKENNEANPKA